MNQQMEQREGPRMRQLRAVFSKAMDRSMKSFRALHMENRFSTLTDSQRPAVAKICEDLICTMKENMEREFDLILAQTKVCEQLNALDKIMVEQSVGADGKRRPEVRPNPFGLIQQKMLDMKKVKRDALKQKLAKELEEIESLKKKCSVVTQQDKENSTELTRVLDTISKIPVV
eukprot:g1594.t1